MSPKTITVVDASGRERQAKLSNEGEYTRLLARHGVSFLIDSERKEIYGFESLVDGNTYILGEPQQQQDTLQGSNQMMEGFLEGMRHLSVSVERKAACRLWIGDPTVFKLPAPSFAVLDAAVRRKYNFHEEEAISYYIIRQKRLVDSRKYISNDEELDDFFDLAGNPTIYVWLRGSPSLSPGSIPSEIQIPISSAESFSESSDSSTRGYV